jgi:hypothetical protein
MTFTYHPANKQIKQTKQNQLQGYRGIPKHPKIQRKDSQETLQTESKHRLYVPPQIVATIAGKLVIALLLVKGREQRSTEDHRTEQEV